MNLKLIKLPKDIIIESLTSRIQDLDHDLKQSKFENKMLMENLNYYKQYSKEMSDFKYYKIFKEKLEEIVNSDDYYIYNQDVDNITYEFNLAYKDKNIDEMLILFEKLSKYQSPELLATIDEQNCEIEDLKAEIKELEQELSDYR